MKKLAMYTTALALSGGLLYAVIAAESPAEPPKEEVAKEALTCFESRKGASEVTQRDLTPGWPNVKCSPTTGAALWYGDPYDGTAPMGKMPGLETVADDQAVVKPRSEKLNLLAMCGTACHNGVGPQFTPPTLPKDRRAKPNPTMEAMVPDLANFQHGRGRIWCLDCHHTTQRNMLVDHFGDPISFDQPQLLCGKCHGDKLRDWRDGIHGKRIGQFVSTGKKRWFTCTECHNPHNVQDGERNRGFVQLQPEPPPQLANGMPDAKHELVHPIAH
jgi:Zn finger protein HypA/HybF involved in hydrogenase expression